MNEPKATAIIEALRHFYPVCSPLFALMHPLTVFEYVVDIESDDSGVHILADKDGLLRGTELKVVEISSQIGNNLTEEAAQKLHSTLMVVSENAEIVSAFDIQLMLDGAKIQPDGMIKIRIPFPANANKYNDLTVVYVADDGTATRINLYFQRTDSSNLKPTISEPTRL